VKIRTLFVSGKGWLQNVSPTGAYIATPMYLLPQARVSLQIVLREERRWVEAEAIVVWQSGISEDDTSLKPGYGIRFVSVPMDTKKLIDELLSGELPMPASEQPRSFAPVREAPAPPAPRRPAVTPLAPAFEIETEREGPPFRLDASQITYHTPERQPGIYVLSYTRTQEARVGRADEDLRATIQSYEGEYAYFWCEIIEDNAARYTRECELFHSLGGTHGQLDNDVHPDSEDFRHYCHLCREDEQL